MMLRTIVIMLLGAALWNAVKYGWFVAWHDYPRVTARHPHDDSVRLLIAGCGVIFALFMLGWLG